MSEAHLSFSSVLICSFVYIFGPVVAEKYRCIREIESKQDKNAIAVVHKERVVGHAPMVVSKYVNMLVRLLASHLEAEVTGKRVNGGGRYGLEVALLQSHLIHKTGHNSN